MKTVILTAVLFVLLAGTAVAQPYWCWDQDLVWAEVLGSTIRVHHEAAVYNCCPEAIIHDTTVEGSLIRIVETEQNPQCLCLCCYDLETVVLNLPAGAWQIDFAWYDYESNSTQHRYLTVAVEVAGAGPPQGGSSRSNPPCLSASHTPIAPDASGTWPSHAPPPILLRSPAPNPTSGTSSIRFALAAPARLRVAVFSTGGALVRALEDRAFVAGEHAVAWDGRDDLGRAVAAGVYLCRVDGPATAASERILVIR